MSIMFVTIWMSSLPLQQIRLLTFFFSSRVRPQAILNSDETSHVLENLDPDTEYSVTVTAIYPDESESEDLFGNERTCKQPPLQPRPALPAPENQPSHFTDSQM